MVCNECIMAKRHLEIRKKQLMYVAGILFFLVSNPYTYSILQKLLGENLANATGCATQMGVLLHTVVFMIIFRMVLGHSHLVNEQ